MKKIFLLLCLFAGSWANATILDVNVSDQTLYFHPTPTFVFSLMDLKQSGGLLSLSLDYNTDETHKEMRLLQTCYGLGSLQAIAAESQKTSTTLAIPGSHLKFNVPLRQGQMGPYINTQVILTSEQMKELRPLENDLDKKLQMPIPMQTNFVSSQVIEEYTATSEICSKFQVTSVKDLISAIGQIKSPRDIKYPQTFESLKSEIINHCFIFTPSSITSFQELLGIQIQPNPRVESLTGQYLEKRSQAINFLLFPHIQVDLN